MPTYTVVHGRFITRSREMRSGDSRGLDMRIMFECSAAADLVVLVQAVKCMKGPTLDQLDEDFDSGTGSVPAGLISGNWHIDAVTAATRENKASAACPGFGLEFGKNPVQGGTTVFNNWRSAGGEGNLGADGGLGCLDGSARNAYVQDQPARTVRNGTAFHHEFEVVALNVSPTRDSPRDGWVLGALRWGYAVSEDGNFTQDVPRAAPKPSESWIWAAQAWNSFVYGPMNRIPGDPIRWAK